MDYRPPDSSVHGISQERILEWLDISFSSGSYLCNAGLGPASPALAGSFFTTEPPRSPCLGLSGPKLNHKREGYEDLTVKGRDKTMEAI